MKYQKLGKTDLDVSVVSFGTWGLGGGTVWQDTQVDDVQVGRLLDAALDLGINYIDTAPVYGTGASEELLGRALAKGRRDKFVLQTKCSLNWRGEGGNFHYERDGYTVNNDTSAAAVRRDVEDSLRRLQTDMIDVIVVHYVCHTWPAQETMGALQDLIQEGKIRAVALSNSQPADLDEYEKYGTVAAVQEQFSLLAPNHGRAYFETAAKHDTVFQAYGLLEEGFLVDPARLDQVYGAGDIRARLPWTQEPLKSKVRAFFSEIEPLRQKYDCTYAALVQAWTRAQFPAMNLLTGFRRVSTMEDTCRALDLVLSDEDVALMDAAATPARVSEIDK